MTSLHADLVSETLRLRRPFYFSFSKENRSTGFTSEYGGVSENFVVGR